MDTTPSVKVIFRPTPTNKKLGNLHVRTILNRKSKFKSLGIQLQKIHWDADLQRVLPTLKNYYKDYNNIIGEALGELKENYNNIEVLQNNNTLIIEYWEQHNQTTINSGTKANRIANLNKFKSFIMLNKMSGLRFHELTPAIVEMYEVYLHQTLQQRSVNTYVGYFKSVVNKAIKHQVVNYRLNPFINHERLTNKNKIARSLGIEQVKQIMTLELTKDKTDYARNMFLFQLFGGGLRVRDLLLLKWKNIVIKDTDIYLLYTQSKTNKEIQSKLSLKALQYLNPVLKELYPNSVKFIETCQTMLNTQLLQKAQWEKRNKFIRYDTSEIIREFDHYDMESSNRYKLNNIPISETELLSLNENIKMYTLDLHWEYAQLLQKVIAHHGTQYIFKFMKGIKLPQRNTDAKVKNKIQGKIWSYNNQLNNIAKLIDIPTFTSHTARHTFAQILVGSNTNLAYIQQYLGHSSLSTTQNYVTALHTSEMDGVSDTLAGHF